MPSQAIQSPAATKASKPTRPRFRLSTKCRWYSNQKVSASRFSRLRHYLFRTTIKSPRIVSNDGSVFPRNYTTNRMNSCQYGWFNFIPLFFFNLYKDSFNLLFLIFLLIQLHPSFNNGSLIRVH